MPVQNYRGPKVNKTINKKRSTSSRRADFDSLYLKLVRSFFEREDFNQARKIADQLEKKYLNSPEYNQIIRADEIRSLIAELNGDFQEAARCREAELRKILELHTLTINTPQWELIAMEYDFSDVSDRLDLLALLYDKQGELQRAILTLWESKNYCSSHGISFDGQDILDELETDKPIAPRRKAKLSK